MMVVMVVMMLVFVFVFVMFVTHFSDLLICMYSA